MIPLGIKTILGFSAIGLTFIGYFPYFRDIFKGKTRPHVFSWLIWAIVTGLIFALQITKGAGVGAYVTLAVSLISFTIFLLGLKNGARDIQKVDVLFLALAILSIPLWLVVDQPVLSMILLSSIDMLGFIPTILKSWNDPYSETLAFYFITTFRHTISVLALVEYNPVTALFPITWVLANGGFAVMLILRRKAVQAASLTNSARS